MPESSKQVQGMNGQMPLAPGPDPSRCFATLDEERQPDSGSQSIVRARHLVLLSSSF